MGIFVPVEIAMADIPFFSKSPANFSIPWISLTCGLNTTLTGLIIGRILYIAHETRLGTNYTGIIAMLIESAAPLSISGIAFAVCAAKSTPGFVPVSNIWATLAVRLAVVHQ